MVEGYFSRYGGRTILIGRFIGLVRALAPFIAGSSKLPYRNFAPFSILGTGLWSTGLILLGYFFSQSLSTVTKVVGQGLLVFAIVVGVAVGLYLAFRFLREPENRGKLAAEMEKRPVLRPLVALGRRLRPQFEFLGRRITPGGLGLELTSLLAVLSVGLFVLIAYWSVIGGDPSADGQGPDTPTTWPRTCRRAGSWTARRRSPRWARAGWSTRWASWWRSSWRSGDTGWSSGHWSSAWL